MVKLTVENLNSFIDSVTTNDTDLGVPMPRTMTYPNQIYIDMDKLIDKRFEFIDLFRQCLVAFSKRKEDIPRKFLFYTGEKKDGNYCRWTLNSDDISRFVSMGMLTKVILCAGNKTVTYNGKTEFGFFITLTNEEIKPIVVIEKPKPMT